VEICEDGVSAGGISHETRMPIDPAQAEMSPATPAAMMYRPLEEAGYPSAIVLT
jgi:hypothetical protein